MSAPYVQINNLGVTFTGGTKPVRAVGGVSLNVRQGQTVALIGGSGSGKSVTLRAIMRLNPENRANIEGSIRVGGTDVMALDRHGLSRFRGAETAMIFQEPLLALNPVHTVGQKIVDSIRRHESISKSDARERAPRPFRARPHPLAGAPPQCLPARDVRRHAPARHDCPRACLPSQAPPRGRTHDRPRCHRADPGALLLRELPRELGLSIIFVTHDIGAAVEVADRVAVMYAGRVVEEASTRDLIRNPRHPYTIGLLRSRAHDAMVKGSQLAAISGSPPDLASLPPGCHFAPRCFLADDKCRCEDPPLFPLEGGRSARCLRLDHTAPEVLHTVADQSSGPPCTSPFGRLLTLR
jgi:peptide/nickel transport system ATP-binding protein